MSTCGTRATCSGVGSKCTWLVMSTYACSRQRSRSSASRSQPRSADRSLEIEPGPLSFERVYWASYCVEAEGIRPNRKLFSGRQYVLPRSGDPPERARRGDVANAPPDFDCCPVNMAPARVTIAAGRLPMTFIFQPFFAESVNGQGRCYAN